MEVPINLTFTDTLSKIQAVQTLNFSPGRRRSWMIEAFPQEANQLTTILDKTDFYEAPASTKYHGAYVGGLFDHSMNVACVLKYLTSIGVCNKWQDSRSPVIVGVLHDFTKLGMYKEDEQDLDKFQINPSRVSYGGHGSDSLIKILQVLALTPEEAICIRYHMGAYEKEDWDGFDRAIKAYPNVLWTHTADMYASKVLEV